MSKNTAMIWLTIYVAIVLGFLIWGELHRIRKEAERYNDWQQRGVCRE